MRNRRLEISELSQHFLKVVRKSSEHALQLSVAVKLKELSLCLTLCFDMKTFMEEWTYRSKFS
jgi:hypothetical protein